MSRDRVSFDYQGKGGVHHTVTLTDQLLAKAVAGLKRARSGGDRLLVYRVGRQCRDVRAEDINERFRELVGDEFSAKDLRTWNATVLAAAILGGEPSPTSRRARSRAITQMYREVSEHLGNTPAVARKSYVDPRLVDLFERGVTIGPALRKLGSADLSRSAVRVAVEHAVRDLLAEHG